MKARRWSQIGLASFSLTGLAVSAWAEPEPDAVRRALAVATYQGGEVTVGEIEDTIADSSPLTQATALESASLQEFLERNLRFELQLQEAERRGYREDERVRKAVKDNAVKLLLGRDIDVPLRAQPASPETLRAYFEQHVEAFSVPEKRRANAIFFASEAEARAQKAAFSSPDSHSGKALGSFDVEGKIEGSEAPLDPALVRAAYALTAVGAVSEPIRLSDKSGYALLKLTEIRPGYKPAFDEVKVRVSRRYDDERYDTAVQAITTSQSERLHPVVHEDVLKLLRPE